MVDSMEHTSGAVDEHRPEERVWEGPSSQVVNLGAFIYSVIAIILLGAAAYGVYFLTQRSAYIEGIQGYLYIGLAVILLIVILIDLYKWLKNANRRYEVTTERVRVTSGILSKSQDELELYRVRDYAMKRPFKLRLFGLGTIVLTTSDKSTPILEIEAVKDANSLLDKIRVNVEHLRRSKEVREIDFE